MSNLEDCVAVQWTCRTIVSSDVDARIRSMGGLVNHPALLQRAAEAVASSAQYECGLSCVDFFAPIVTRIGEQPIELRVQFDATPEALAVVSLKAFASDLNGSTAERVDDLGGERLLMDTESQAVRHERA